MERSRQSWALRGTVVALALVVGLVAWLATRDHDRPTAAATEVESRIVDPGALADAAALAGHPVYWAGQNEGGFVELGETRLARGIHDVELRFGGADLHPGSAGFPRPETGPLLFSPAGEEAGQLVTGPDRRRRALCGQPWDWIEVVGSL